jgi:hypothetical protein
VTIDSRIEGRCIGHASRALLARPGVKEAGAICAGRAAGVSVLKYLWLSHRQPPRIPGDASLLEIRRVATDTRAQAGSAHAEPPCNA